MTYSSIKWIDCDKNVVRLPIATINCLLLGPGTSLTHEAVKVMAAANCSVCWAEEDSLLFYAAGITPTADSRNLRRQMQLATDKKKSIEVARRMFARRLPPEELKGKSLKEMMGMEGYRMRQFYEEKAQEYGVGWKGRRYVPGKFEMGDITNQVLTSTNAALYTVWDTPPTLVSFTQEVRCLLSTTWQIFIKRICASTSPFRLPLEMAGRYNRQKVSSAFRKRVIKMDILARIGPDLEEALGGKRRARRYSK